MPLPAPRPIRDGFDFDNVTFAYPLLRSSRNILDHLRFPAGARLKRVALIGEEWARQDHAPLSCLPRACMTPTGRAHPGLDGVDLREYSIEDLHSQIGVIFQDFMR